MSGSFGLVIGTTYAPRHECAVARFTDACTLTRINVLPLRALCPPRKKGCQLIPLAATKGRLVQPLAALPVISPESQ